MDRPHLYYPKFWQGDLSNPDLHYLRSFATDADYNEFTNNMDIDNITVISNVGPNFLMTMNPMFFTLGMPPTEFKGKSNYLLVTNGPFYVQVERQCKRELIKKIAAHFGTPLKIHKSPKHLLASGRKRISTWDLATFLNELGEVCFFIIFSLYI